MPGLISKLDVSKGARHSGPWRERDAVTLEGENGAGGPMETVHRTIGQRCLERAENG